MKIYTMTMMTHNIHSDEDGYFPEFEDRRCIGFFKNYKSAIFAMWLCNLHREDYEYCMIEEISDGIFKETTNRWLFKRTGNNKEDFIYVPITEPKEFAMVRNFGVG